MAQDGKVGILRESRLAPPLKRESADDATVVAKRLENRKRFGGGPKLWRDNQSRRVVHHRRNTLC